MPNITIYVPQHLHDRVKRQQLPVSEICQRALKREISRLERHHDDRQSIDWAETQHQEGQR